jgi:PIN domain nuclease of toxin-antitoxin system
MKFLLDTCVFLWFISEDKNLSTQVKNLLIDNGNQVYLSPVSIWECAIKQQINKLDFPQEATLFLSEQRKLHLIDTINITEKTISYLHLLPNHHKDPFDRLLICQAIENDFIFITEDSQIVRYEVEGFKVLKN